MAASIPGSSSWRAHWKQHKRQSHWLLVDLRALHKTASSSVSVRRRWSGRASDSHALAHAGMAPVVLGMSRSVVVVMRLRHPSVTLTSVRESAGDSNQSGGGNGEHDRVRDLRCHGWYLDGETELSCVLGTDVPRARDRRARDSSVVAHRSPRRLGNRKECGECAVVRSWFEPRVGRVPRSLPDPSCDFQGSGSNTRSPGPGPQCPVNVRGSELMVTATVAPWMIPNSAPRGTRVGGRVILGGAAGFGDRDCLYGWAEAGGRIIRVACVPLARRVVVDFSCLCHRGRRSTRR